MRTLQYIALWGFVFIGLILQGKAQINYLPTQLAGDQLIHHKHYTLSYHEAWEQPSWVAYELSPRTISGTIKRTNNFRSDPAVKTGSATLKDYSKSGFDRGHLLPAASMKCSREAMSETFYMSNMSPQRPYFNRGIWKKLEAQVRKWAQTHHKIYVVSGPIVQNNHKTIGHSKVAIPHYYYKVILDPIKKKGIGFILSNEKSSQPLTSFLVPIDKIEKQTGLDFFPQLPDDIEQRIERGVQSTGWF